jgi:type VI secretion system protein ImpK
MSDNPFSEPEDIDRTFVRIPGSKSAAPPPPPAPAMAPVSVPSAPARQLNVDAEPVPKVGLSPMAAAAAPILDLLARIGAGAQSPKVANAVELRQRAMRAMQTFEAECRAAGVPDDQLRAGHYALCAALDDVALATPWGVSSGWGTHSLSSTFHQDVRFGERFFEMLTGLQKDPGHYRQALEICYLCLALGLRGRYRIDSRGGAELERIREGLYQLLAQLRGPWERELSPHWRGVDAPHRGPGRSVPTWVAAAVAVALLGFGYIFASNRVNAESDALQQRLTLLPPSALAAIDRTTAPVPPTAAPAALGSDPLEKVRGFLAPEIRDGLVVVDGDAQRLMVRIKGRGMFASGSADIEPGFVPLLGRVGQALRDEPGRVVVLGHSDNQPIRTVQFPSNFQLSAARAATARTIVAGASGQPQRFTSAGRADTEPLASNDTLQGRDENRRIEVVLTRGEGG